MFHNTNQVNEALLSSDHLFEEYYSVNNPITCGQIFQQSKAYNMVKIIAITVIIRKTFYEYSRVAQFGLSQATRHPKQQVATSFCSPFGIHRKNSHYSYPMCAYDIQYTTQSNTMCTYSTGNY